VAVSETGLSWRRHGRAHVRAWSEFAGMRRKVVDLYRTGRRLEAAYGSEVQFHTGRPLLISPDTVREYDALLAAIEAGARGRAGLGGSSFGGSSCDRLPGWTSQFGAAPEEGLWFGPLRLRPDGVQWGKKLLHWDHVKSYEVSHGYLLITAEDGTEFLRRLPELGDWQLALDRLDELIGAKRVGALAAAK
jgi:hypothetical protein